MWTNKGWGGFGGGEKSWEKVRRGEKRWIEVGRGEKNIEQLKKLVKNEKGWEVGAAVERGGGKARTNSENSCEASLHFL
jgi:hypothetical protein